MIEHKIPEKNHLSMRLDKRLYSKLSVDGISLCSAKSNHRAVAEIVKYGKLENLFKKYPTQDPLIFKRGDRFFLAIPFNVQDVPVQNNDCIGVDLGERRFAITSDGIMFNDKEYNARRRKLRYLKRCLQSKGTKSARKHKRVISIKEQRQSDDMCHKVANAIIASTTASHIVLEDLSKIKKATSRNKNGYKKTNHNRRMAQIPFYKLKHILSYKALLAGKQVETVSPYMTSQTDCVRNLQDGTRKNRRYYTADGRVFDSDWNASVNIALKSKHPFSFITPIDGGIKTWRAGYMSTSQSYANPCSKTGGVLQAHPI